MGGAYQLYCDPNESPEWIASCEATKANPISSYTVYFMQDLIMATGIDNTTQQGNAGEPQGVGYVFTNTDNYVYAWMKLTGVIGSYDIRFKWYAPDGKVIRDVTHRLEYDTALYYTLSWYKTWDAFDMSTQTQYGKYIVEAYVDGKLESRACND